MANQNKSMYQKTHDTLDKHLNPEGYTIGDVILQRVKWIAILVTIGLVYNGIAWLFKKPAQSIESDAKTSSETIVVARFEKKPYDPNYTNDVVSDIKSQLPMQNISKKLKVTSISHQNRQINLDMILENANPSQNMQVMKYYCGTSVFKPLIEQDLHTHIRVMNGSNGVAFETDILGMADCL